MVEVNMDAWSSASGSSMVGQFSGASRRAAPASATLLVLLERQAAGKRGDPTARRDFPRARPVAVAQQRPAAEGL